jgi:ATP-dependent helicase/nuclease subunit A
LETYTQLPLWERVLRPLCNTPASLESAVATVFDHLRKCTKTTQGNWLFNTRHHDDKCELAICDYSSGKRRDFAVDRTFVDSDGQRWIIDYKSVSPAPGQTLADFFEVQTAFYRPQLENYGRLLSQNGEPVRLALFFTAIPAFHVLE